MKWNNCACQRVAPSTSWNDRKSWTQKKNFWQGHKHTLCAIFTKLIRPWLSWHNIYLYTQNTCATHTHTLPLHIFTVFGCGSLSGCFADAQRAQYCTLLVHSCWSTWSATERAKWCWQNVDIWMRNFWGCAGVVLRAPDSNPLYLIGNFPSLFRS